MNKTLTSLAVIAIGVSIYKNTQVPDGLGVDNRQLAKLPTSPNAVSSQTEQENKYVQPLEFEESLATSRRQILAILEQNPQIIILEQTENYIHAVATSSILKFKDDIEFYFDQEEEVIHFRSASRTGYWDFGVNRKRYNKLKGKYYHFY